MKHQALLFSDMPGYGKVALAAMSPVLSHMGVGVFCLPTALVSNTLNYGKYSVLDTTDYIKETLSVWEELGFSFEAVSTGFIANEFQAALIAGYCREQSKKGVKIFCDPIMADNGKLYNGMSEKTVKTMRELVSCADYILPNYTEAALLSGMEYRESPTEQEIRETIRRLRALGAKSVVITSVHVDAGFQTACYDQKTGEYFCVPYTPVPGSFPGTGDLFSAVFLGAILLGGGMRESVSRAVSTVGEMIRRNASTQEQFPGIQIESCLDVLDKK